MTMRTQWNTGNLYSAQGQRIIAEWNSDTGHILFNDIDRGCSGVLAIGTAYNGGDSIGAKVFKDMDALSIMSAVNSHYVRGYNTRYDSRANDLEWED